jgi:hypothetical protein
MATSMQKSDDIDPAQQKAEADQAAQHEDVGAEAEGGEAQAEDAEQQQAPPVANLRGPASGDSFGLTDDVQLDYEVTSAADCKLHWTLHDKDGNAIGGDDHDLAADPDGGSTETRAAINAADQGLGEGEYEVRYWAENDFGSSDIQSIKLVFVDQEKAEGEEVAETEKKQEDEV